MYMTHSSFTVSTENVTVEVNADEAHTKLTVTIRNASIVTLSGTATFRSQLIGNKIRECGFQMLNGHNVFAVRNLLELFASRRDYLTVDENTVTITDASGETPVVFSTEIGV